MQLVQEVYLTRNEVAKQLRVSVVSVDRWRKAGILSFYKAGGRIRFKYEDVQAFLKTSTSSQTPNS